MYEAQQRQGRDGANLVTSKGQDPGTSTPSCCLSPRGGVAGWLGCVRGTGLSAQDWGSSLDGFLAGSVTPRSPAGRPHTAALPEQRWPAWLRGDRLCRPHCPLGDREEADICSRGASDMLLCLCFRPQDRSELFNHDIMCVFVLLLAAWATNSWVTEGEKNLPSLTSLLVSEQGFPLGRKHWA